MHAMQHRHGVSGVYLVMLFVGLIGGMGFLRSDKTPCSMITRRRCTPDQEQSRSMIASSSVTPCKFKRKKSRDFFLEFYKVTSFLSLGHFRRVGLPRVGQTAHRWLTSSQMLVLLSGQAYLW